MCLAILSPLPLHRQQNLSWSHTSLSPPGYRLEVLQWRISQVNKIEKDTLLYLLDCFSSLQVQLDLATFSGSSLQTPVHTKHQGRLEQPLGQSGSNISRLNFCSRRPPQNPCLTDSGAAPGPET
jgi:hypothetical protein